MRTDGRDPHLCLITCKEPATVHTAHMKLPALIPGIASLKVGRELDLEGNAHYAVVAAFNSEDAFKAYSVHDAHMNVIYPALGHYMATYSTAQFKT
ncbi:MAG: Dabb family protein [Rhodospirillales bacterium]|nr:Dabb family protein [Rhodospirillales bacterium]